jgi:hypothetical protein
MATTYAQISNGTVWEIITPNDAISNLYSPSFVAGLVNITGRYPVPQVGWTATKVSGVWQFAPPTSPTPTLAQRAQLMLVSGIQVASASNATGLNGTYPVDPETRSDYQAEMISLLVNKTFTSGATTIALPDVSGVMHTFTTAQFTSFVTVLGSTITTLKQIAVSGTGTLPTPPVSIA